MLSLRQYWQVLEDDIKKFNVFVTTKEDQANYERQKKTLCEMLKRGFEIEDAWNPQKKIALGKESKAIPETAFAKTGGIPSIDGPLSCTYAERVYLPYLERLATVDFPSIADKIAPEELKPKNAKALAAENARVLRERIEAYKKANPTFTSVQAPSMAELRSQLDSLKMLWHIVQHLPTDKDRTKKSLKDILDLDKRYKTLDECLEKSNLIDAMKKRLLDYEKNNTYLGRFRGRYRPAEFLEATAFKVGILSEMSQIEKKIKKINDTPYTQSLLACLDALLKERKSDFYDSDKCNYVRKLKDKLGKMTVDVKEEIEKLKEIVSVHRDEKKMVGANARKKCAEPEYF